MNLKDFALFSESYLKAHSSDPKKDAEEILSFHLKMKKSELWMHADRVLGEEECAIVKKSLERRANKEPLEYIFGIIDFFHLQLEVSPKVLIPRQETEILLSLIIERLAKEDTHKKVVWDLCTGSGCLGLGLKKAFPQLQVSLSDLSFEALQVAKNNAHKNQLEVEFMQGNLLEPFQGKHADIILCNPPYISAQEFETLDIEVRSYEPKMALVSGHSGLEFYERLGKELPVFLSPNAKIFFEIGHTQKKALLEIFSDSCWQSVRIEQDWSGKDRFFSAIFLEFG